MASRTKICSVNEIPAGSMKTVFLNGKRIAVAHVDEDFFAIDDTCTHAECSLGGEGFLDANVVICGCHGAQFDVTNGHVLSLPATVSLKSYKVVQDGSDLVIEE